MRYAPVTLNDSPRYLHRGLMIDTARHYLSVSEILRMIDSLVMNKFNKLHWHLVDAQSFPYDSPTEPTMINGAFVNHNKQLVVYLSMGFGNPYGDVFNEDIVNEWAEKKRGIRRGGSSKKESKRKRRGADRS